MKFRKSVFAAYCLFFLLGICVQCNTNNEREKDVISYGINDPKVLNAQRLAQNNLGKFDSIWEVRRTGYKFFIKREFNDYEKSEHMWVDIIDISENYIGILDNEPLDVLNVSFLDTVYISKNEVEDFFISRNDTLIAGNFIEHNLNSK